MTIDADVKLPQAPTSRCSTHVYFGGLYCGHTCNDLRLKRARQAFQPMFGQE